MKQNKVKLYAKALAEILAKERMLMKKNYNNFVKLLIKMGRKKKQKKF